MQNLKDESEEILNGIASLCEGKHFSAAMPAMAYYIGTCISKLSKEEYEHFFVLFRTCVDDSVNFLYKIQREAQGIHE